MLQTAIINVIIVVSISNLEDIARYRAVHLEKEVKYEYIQTVKKKYKKIGRSSS